MRRPDRPRPIAVLLALPVVLASLVSFRGEPVYAGLPPSPEVCTGGVAADAQNTAPCRTFNTYGSCTPGCGTGSLVLNCPCFWDDPTNPNGFPSDMGFGSGNGTNCTPETPCCWNKPCWTFVDEGACAIGGGSAGGEIDEDGCHWFAEEGRCGCSPPLVDVLQCVDPSQGHFAPFDCQCPYLTREEWLAQGARGACAPPALDHFLLYKTKTSKGAPRFVRFGSVVLSDAFQSDASYQVTKPVKLGLPADKNGEGVSDPDTHREEYLVRPVKGGPVFAKRSDVRVVNQCNDLLLEVVKPVSLLVPTSKSLTDPVTAPDPVHHNLEHFLCYQAKPQAKLADGTKLPKFPKGMQVEVADQFQTRLYDLVRITKLCNPVDKAGTPTLLAGPNKGEAKPIAPATRVADEPHLVCYQARVARKAIAQGMGCGPATPGDTGTTIVPAQPKHAPVTGLFVANQFGAERLDTVTEAELCIPSSVD